MEKNKDFNNKSENKYELSKQSINKDPLQDILSTNRKKKLVLILEDGIGFVKLYSRFFSDYNCRILTTLSNAKEELVKLKKEGIEPSILIADFHLPDGESTDFVNKIKEMYPKIKIILSSSDYDAERLVKHDVRIEKGKIIELKKKIDEFLSDNTQ